MGLSHGGCFLMHFQTNYNIYSVLANGRYIIFDRMSLAEHQSIV